MLKISWREHTENEEVLRRIKTVAKDQIETTEITGTCKKERKLREQNTHRMHQRQVKQ